jgi:hypothetical protein
MCILIAKWSKEYKFAIAIYLTKSIDNECIWYRNTQMILALNILLKKFWIFEKIFITCPEILIILINLNFGTLIVRVWTLDMPIFEFKNVTI